MTEGKSKRSFLEHFDISISRLDADGRLTTGFGTAGGDSLASALAIAFRWSCFYMGPGGARVEIGAHCAACNGRGAVNVEGKRRTARCTACKGVSRRECVAFLAQPSEHCEIFRYGERVSAPQTQAP